VKTLDRSRACPTARPERSLRYDGTARGEHGAARELRSVTPPGRRAARAGGGEEHERRRSAHLGRARELADAACAWALARPIATLRSARNQVWRAGRRKDGAAREV